MLFFSSPFYAQLFLIVCNNVCNNLQYVLDMDGLKSSRPFDVKRAADFYRKHAKEQYHLARAYLVSTLWNYNIYLPHLHVLLFIALVYFSVSPSCTASVFSGLPSYFLFSTDSYSLLQDFPCVWAISSRAVRNEQIQCYVWYSWLLSICQRRASIKELIPFGDCWDRKYSHWFVFL